MADFNYPAYEEAKRNYGQQFAAASARNAYTRFLAQQRGNRQQYELGKAFQEQTPRMISSYTRRNLAGPGIKSGVYERGMQNYLQQNFDAQEQARQEMLNALRESDLTSADLEAEYRTKLAELEAQKQGQIAQAAAMLQSFKPFLGG